MYMNIKYITILIISALTTAVAEAKVNLPHIISSGMVVQRDKPLTIWGTADPGEIVSLKVAKGKSAKTEADSAGTPPYVSSRFPRKLSFMFSAMM